MIDSDDDDMIKGPSIKLLGPQKYKIWKEELEIHLDSLGYWGYINGHIESTWHTEQRQAQAAESEEWFPPYKGIRPPPLLSEIN